MYSFSDIFMYGKLGVSSLIWIIKSFDKTLKLGTLTNYFFLTTKLGQTFPVKSFLESDFSRSIIIPGLFKLVPVKSIRTETLMHCNLVQEPVNVLFKLGNQMKIYSGFGPGLFRNFISYCGRDPVVFSFLRMWKSHNTEPVYCR